MNTSLLAVTAAVAAFGIPSLGSLVSAAGVSEEILCRVPEQPVPALLDRDQWLPRDSGPAPFVENGIAWLVKAQHPDGGWGGGSHGSQQIRNPHGVATDPGTTALSAMALLRAGHTPLTGSHRDVVKRATLYLLETVEASADRGPRITDLTGTQPQAKMGAYVDTALCAQFLSRVLPEVEPSELLHQRVSVALDKCLRKIQDSQSADGSWGQGGWAPVLQSSLMSSALESGSMAGRRIDDDVLRRGRDYQSRQVTEDGRVVADAAAGVALYASAGNMRANAQEAKQASEIIARAKQEGVLEEDVLVSRESLQSLGIEAPRAAELEAAYSRNEAAKARSFDESLLSGFGNNGGEEFLSYLMNSESLVISGGEAWDQWNLQIHERLARVQNGDGSWSGHHCITSPVFCTAAVVLCLTAEQDADLLSRDVTDQGDGAR